MTSHSSGTDAGKGTTEPEKAANARRSHARRKSSRTLAQAVVGVVAALLTAAIIMAFMFPMGRAGPEAVPNAELEAAKTMYNQAFRLMGRKKYDGALPEVAAACTRFTELVDKYQDLAWVEDYFQRLARWERELREWEFARESEAFRKGSPPE